MERQAIDLWCPKCQESWETISRESGVKKEPPCEQCRPKIDPSNLEAWEIFQMVSNDASGITIQGIQAACQLLDVLDSKECYLKVMEIAKRIRSTYESVKPVKEEQDG